MRRVLHPQPNRRCVFDRLEERALLSYGFGAPGDGKLSLTFLGALYPDTLAGIVAFQADVQKCEDALKTIEPYASRFGQFEFHTLPFDPSLTIYYLPEHHRNPSADYAKVDQIVTASGITTDVAVVLVQDPFEGGTGEHQIPVVSNNSSGMAGTFIHELSHSLGTSGDPQAEAYTLLLDEYVYNPPNDRPYDNKTHQNIFAGDPAAGTPPAWNDFVAPDEYFRGATYANWYRPSPRSMMVHPGAKSWFFNAVSHGLLKHGLDYWGGPFTDLEAPKAAFAGLRDGDTVSGAVPVATTLSDNVGVVRTQLWVDGRLARNAYAAPFTLDWLTGSTAPGAYTLQVKAFDAVGNVGLSPLVHVNLVNPADITIRTPTSGSTVGSTLDIGAFHVTVDTWDEALDNVLVWVDDNTATAKRAYTAPYAVDLSTSGLTPGVHTLHAVGYAVGTGTQQLYATSIPFTFEVLTVAIASPAENTSVAGIVPVVIDVTQGHPTRMELTYGNRSGIDTTLVLNAAPWVFSWDTMTAPNFTEGLFLKAYEGTGSVILPIRMVTVANGAGSIEEPKAGDTLSGTARVIWSASNKFVHRVEFRVDGNLIDSANQNGIVVFDWDTLTTTNGPHTLSVVASNAYGWSQTYNLPINVQNALVALASPGRDATVSGRTPVQLLDPTGLVAKVGIFIDGKPATTIGQAPFTWTWDTRSLADGPHTVRVDYDYRDGAFGSFAVPVTVDNFDVRFAPPAPDAKVKGRTPVLVSAPAGNVVRATVGVDAKTLGNLVKAPFALTWDTTKVPDGTHLLWARVFNAQGGSSLVTQTVLVRNDRTLPTVTLTSPAANAKLHAKVTVRGRATDPVGISRVEVLVDNKVIASAIPVGKSFVIAVDLSRVQVGVHKLRLRAFDRSGNVGQSTVINVRRL